MSRVKNNIIFLSGTGVSIWSSLLRTREIPTPHYKTGPYRGCPEFKAISFFLSGTNVSIWSSLLLTRDIPTPHYKGGPYRGCPKLEIIPSFCQGPVYQFSLFWFELGRVRHHITKQVPIEDVPSKKWSLFCQGPVCHFGLVRFELGRFRHHITKQVPIGDVLR